MKIRYRLGIIRPCRKRDLDPDRPGYRICLYSRSRKRKLLGRHRSTKSAEVQERAIQAAKHSR